MYRKRYWYWCILRVTSLYFSSEGTSGWWGSPVSSSPRQNLCKKHSFNPFLRKSLMDLLNVSFMKVINISFNLTVNFQCRKKITRWRRCPTDDGRCIFSLTNCLVEHLWGKERRTHCFSVNRLSDVLTYRFITIILSETVAIFAVKSMARCCKHGGVIPSLERVALHPGLAKLFLPI